MWIQPVIGSIICHDFNKSVVKPTTQPHPDTNIETEYDTQLLAYMRKCVYNTHRGNIISL